MGGKKKAEQPQEVLAIEDDQSQPKRTRTTGKQADKRVAAEAELAQKAAEQKKKDQTNLVTTLKNQAKAKADADAEDLAQAKRAADLLEHYQSLDKNDKEKSKLLEEWKKDKKLHWWQHYRESRIHSKLVSQNTAAGYCTKCFCNSNCF